MNSLASSLDFYNLFVKMFGEKEVLAGAAAIVKPAAAAPQQTAATSPEVEVITTDSPGSDYMVDVIKSLGIDVLFAMPGGSFGDLHESVINYGNNEKPEFYTCMRCRSFCGVSPLRTSTRTSSTSRTSMVNGFWMNCTPLSSAPRRARTLAV